MATIICFIIITETFSGYSHLVCEVRVMIYGAASLVATRLTCKKTKAGSILLTRISHYHRYIISPFLIRLKYTLSMCMYAFMHHW